jgi:hypothetical protein
MRTTLLLETRSADIEEATWDHYLCQIPGIPGLINATEDLPFTISVFVRDIVVRSDFF